PIGPYDGDAIARIVIEQRVSAIVSLAHIHDDALQRVFLAAFMRRLRAKPRGNFHLIVDEAEEVCPQMAPDDVAFGLTRDMIWIAKRGRVAGFVLHLITQRPADVSKAVLSQAQTIIAHQPVEVRTAALATIGRAVAEIHLETVSAGKERPRAPSEPVPPAGGGEAARTPAKVRPPASPNPKPNGDDQALRRGRKALLPLARIYPARLSEAQWATLAGFSKSGGTWGTYKGALRGAGYIEQDGEKWGATLTGVEASGIEIEPLP